MKTTHAAACVAGAVVVTAAIQEYRIAALRESLNQAVPAVASSSAPVTPSTSDDGSGSTAAVPPARTKSRTEPRQAPSAATPGDPPAGDSIAATARKMWDNPAGKSMMNQGVKMAVAMMYQDFIDSLDLSKEETDYFKNLLGREMTGQQEIGMKMMGASAEERNRLVSELSKRSAEAEEEIRKFLNNDDDFNQYTRFKERLPERQQLDGIRAVMDAKGLTLPDETAGKLVDAMFLARTGAKTPAPSSPEAIEALASGNMAANFEQSWAAQQEILKTEAAKVLDESRLAAFLEYQQQAKEMQLMGLKMAEKMMGKPAENPR